MIEIKNNSDQEWHVCNAFYICANKDCYHREPHKNAIQDKCSTDLKCAQINFNLRRCIPVEIIGKSKNNPNKLIYRFI